MRWRWARAASSIPGTAAISCSTADVIFAIGTSLTRHNISTPIIPPGKTIIHATNDTRDLYKANDTALPILGDAKLVLAQLIEAVKDRLGDKTHSTGARQRIADSKAAWLARWEAKLRSPERPINPYFVMSEFMRVDPVGRRDRDPRFRQPARPALAVLSSRRSRAAIWAGASRTSSAPASGWRSAPRSARPTRCASTSWATRLSA